MSLAVHKEIVNWKLEARLEDISRYFYQPAELPRIRSGDRSFVIGRKGAGKTAISEHLYRSNGPTTFTAKLTFKNFPFNDLYALTNASYRPPNQYITLWKYLIYSSVAKMMASNQAIDSVVRSQLEKIYQNDPSTSLPRVIDRWTSAEFGANILGNGVSASKERTRDANGTPWVDRVAILEGLIEEHIDDSEYLVVFDEGS